MPGANMVRHPTVTNPIPPWSVPCHPPTRQRCMRHCGSPPWDRNPRQGRPSSVCSSPALTRPNAVQEVRQHEHCSAPWPRSPTTTIQRGSGSIHVSSHTAAYVCDICMYICHLSVVRIAASGPRRRSCYNPTPPCPTTIPNPHRIRVTTHTPTKIGRGTRRPPRNARQARARSP